MYLSTTTRLAGLLLWLLLAMPCQAKPKVLYDYWGIHHQSLYVDSPSIASAASRAISLNLGHHLSPSTALETQLFLPSNQVSSNWNGQIIQQKINSAITPRVRKGLFYYNGFEGYGLLGLSFISLDYSDATNSLNQASKMVMDISYGVGTRFRIGKQTNLTGNIEYNQLLSTHSFSLSSFSLGISYYFK